MVEFLKVLHVVIWSRLVLFMVFNLLGWHIWNWEHRVVVSLLLGWFKFCILFGFDSYRFLLFLSLFSNLLDPFLSNQLPIASHTVVKLTPIWLLFLFLFNFLILIFTLILCLFVMFSMSLSFIWFLVFLFGLDFGNVWVLLRIRIMRGFWGRIVRISILVFIVSLLYCFMLLYVCVIIWSYSFWFLFVFLLLMTLSIVSLHVFCDQIQLIVTVSFLSLEICIASGDIDFLLLYDLLPLILAH